MSVRNHYLLHAESFRKSKSPIRFHELIQVAVRYEGGELQCMRGLVNRFQHSRRVPDGLEIASLASALRIRRLMWARISMIFSPMGARYEPRNRGRVIAHTMVVSV